MHSSAVAAFASTRAISRCAETGLTVGILVEQGLAWLRFITVDRIHEANRATARALEAWVAAHEGRLLARASEAL